MLQTPPRSFLARAGDHVGQFADRVGEVGAGDVELHATESLDQLDGAFTLKAHDDRADNHAGNPDDPRDVVNRLGLRFKVRLTMVVLVPAIVLKTWRTELMNGTTILWSSAGRG